MIDAFEIPELNTSEGHLLVDRLLEATVDAALLVDRELRTLYLTAGFTELTGQKFSDCQGKHISALKIGDYGPVEAVLASGTRRMGVTMQIGGQLLLTNIIPVKWENQVTGAVVMVLFRSMAVLKRAIIEQERMYPREAPATRQEGYSFGDYIGDSPMILTLIEQCHRIAHSSHPVLLMGETGVGKEILAGGIYQEYSGGKDIPFIKINCSAIPKDLLESELFGHEKGAFTGAASTKKGKFELAAGGVLLLDEIGEMDLSLQSKLLRVLEEREFERIGGTRTIPLTAKIIASTNENLKQMAANRQFRMDLYYRLSVFEINIPPLRAHKQDLPKLIEHFQKLDHLDLEFTPDARDMMFHYNWPGNVRELRNVLTRLHFLYPNTVIDQQHIYSATGEMFHLVQLEDYHSGEEMPPPTQAQTHYDKEGNLLSAEMPSTPAPSPSPAAATPASAQEPILTLSQMEEKHIRSTLAAVGQNYSEAARLLGISRSTLYGKVKKYGIA
jgi:transcriptional regulator with PAS, ATPase and Fis domain